jgi:hypothetical protein
LAYAHPSKLSRSFGIENKGLATPFPQSSALKKEKEKKILK